MKKQKLAEGKKKVARSSFKKSRGACLTCKIRHVKCDEGKPQCVKCKGTGRVCEYHNPSAVVVAPFAECATILPGLSSSRTSKEHRYFERFRTRTVLGLMGVNVKSTFWSTHILQFCEAFPAVLHSVIAISALHEYLDNPSTATHRLFLQQYNKSIRHIQVLASENQAQVILTCCVIFICLENAQGNQNKALEHLESGLKIFKQWQDEKSLAPSERDSQKLIKEIITPFDSQATGFWDSRVPSLIPPADIEEPTYTGSHFVDLRDAKNALQYYESRAAYLLTSVSPKTALHKPGFEQTYHLRIRLLNAFAAGMTKWKNFFDGLCVAENAKWSMKELQSSITLRLHYEAISLVVALRTDSRVDTIRAPPSFGPTRYRSIINISRALIQSQNSNDDFELSADPGVIPSLYLAAMTAPTEDLYEESIALLRLVRKQEGFWNASTVVRKAEEVNKRKRAGEFGPHLTGGVWKLAELAAAADSHSWTGTRYCQMVAGGCPAAEQFKPS